MIKTLLAKLDVSRDGMDSLEEFERVYCKLYNYISEEVFKQGRFLGEKEIHDLTYYPSKAKFKLPAQIVIKARQDVYASYRSMKSNKVEPKVPCFKNHFSLQLDERTYSKFTQTSIKFTTNFGRLEYKIQPFALLDEHFSKYEVLDPKLVKKNGEFYLAIPFNIPNLLPKDSLKEEEAIGIDLGMKRLVTTSEGEVLKSSEYLKQKRKVRYLRKQLRKANTKSAKKHLKKIKTKERNYSKNYVHNIVNEILKTDKEVIVIEDLTKIKEDTKHQGKTHNERLSQIPFYLIKTILIYKAHSLGKRVITVDPAYTSQNDSRGKKYQRGIRKGCRYYTTDGLVFDSDWNAAINIVKRSKIPFAFQLPIDGTLKPFKAGHHNQLANRICKNPKEI